MQVAGGGGGITVNTEAALKAAQGFDTEGEAIDDAKSKADTVEGTLSGWEGKAADNAKKSLTMLSSCMTELSTGVMAHASLVTSAVQTFVEADDAAAASMNP